MVLHCWVYLHFSYMLYTCFDSISLFCIPKLDMNLYYAVLILKLQCFWYR
jgi:hypothetical protein